MKIIELKQKKAKLLSDMRKLVADAPESGLTAESRAQFDAMNSDVVLATADIERFEALEADERAAVSAHTPEQENDPQLRAFRNYVRTGDRAELRAINSTDDGAVIPASVASQIFENVQKVNFFRNFAEIVRTTNTTTIPYVGDVAVTVEGESDELAETEPAISPVVLGAYKMSALAKVNEEMLADSSINIEALLSRKFGQGFSKAEITQFATGSGIGTYEGVFSGAGVGVTTASATAATIAEIVALYHSLSDEYRDNPACGFIMNGTVLAAIRSLKLKSETDGLAAFWNYNPSPADGKDYLLGKRVYVVAGAAGLVANAKPVFFGDLSQLIVADRGQTTFQRLNELFAANGQVGFRAWKRGDSHFPNSAAGKVLVMDDGV